MWFFKAYFFNNLTNTPLKKIAPQKKSDDLKKNYIKEKYGTITV